MNQDNATDSSTKTELSSQTPPISEACVIHKMRAHLPESRDVTGHGCKHAFLDTRRDGDYKIRLMNYTIPAEQANRTPEVLPDLLPDPQGSNSRLASCLFSGMLVGAVGIEPTTFGLKG